MRKLLMSLFGLLFMMIVPQHVFAVDYTIEQMSIDVYLQEDGHVAVTEQFTYDFPSSFNGIIRTLHAKEGTSIIDVIATEEGTSLTVERDENDYLIHRQGKNETITIELMYMIENGLDLYNDIGEFYWSFIDENNPSDYEQATITVHPPNQTEDAIALGYGAAEGIADISDGGQVKYAFGKLSSGVGADIRIAYDRELFPEAMVTEDIAMREEIIAEKNEQIEAQETFIKQQATAKKVAPYMIALFGIYFFMLIVYAWRKNKRVMAEIDRRYVAPFFVPEEIMSLPATILYMRSMLTGQALTAALLDLVRKGHVKQDDESSFVVQNKMVEHFHEKHLIDWLFYIIGTEGHFQPGDLKAYTDDERNQEQYQKDYTTYQQAVHDELASHHLYETNGKQRLFIGLSSLLIIPCFVYLAIYEQWIAVILAGLLLIGILIFALVYRPRTLLGKKIKRDWDHLQEKYPSIESDDWESLRDDEQRRAFIYSLGFNDKQMATKNELLLQEENIQIFPGLDPTTLIVMSAFMSSQFNHANSVSAESSSVSTIGTGTGVGGSGGGSSAF